MEVHEDGHRIRTALRHRDRERAKCQADNAAAQFEAVEELQDLDLRVGSLLEKYLGEVTPNKTPHKAQHDRRASRMFVEFFGWKDAQTILECYQQPDEGLIREALDHRGGPDPGPESTGQPTGPTQLVS